MKRIIIGVAAALLMIAGSAAASAQEGTGVEVGLKMWFNDWTHDVPGFPSITSDNTVLLGPAIEAKFGDYFFAEASFLFSTADYDFSDGTRIDRQDVNLAIGYMIIPGFGVLAGYKNSDFKWKTTNPGEKDRVYGPLLGIVGIAQVDPYLSFYGRFNYLFTKFKSTGVAPGIEEDSPGWIFEFGLKYAFTREFTGSIGYKYETNEGNDSNVRDTFSGLTLSGMVAF